MWRVACLSCVLAACGSSSSHEGTDAGSGGNTGATISGTVTGLGGTLMLQNGTDSLSIGADGPFEFAMPIAIGASYDVFVEIQPSGQFCAVTHGAGTATGDVTDVMISCGAPFTGQRISGSGRNVFALHADNTLWAWGSISRFPALRQTQFGNSSDWRSLASGLDGSCGLHQDGSLWCWGNNAEGEVGDGTTMDRLEPVAVGTDLDWRSIERGLYETCAIKADGSLWCWGHSFGITPQHVGTDSWRDLTIGPLHTCGVHVDGSLWCWGSNQFGQLGNGDISGATQPSPVKIGTATWLEVAAGVRYTCGIQSDHSLWCWGVTDQGGNNFLTSYAPVQLGSDVGWTNLSSGEYHLCTQKLDHSWWCFGANVEGDLGDGTVTTRPLPVAVLGSFSDLEPSDENTCGITPANEIQCWGSNDEGQLGLGYTADSDVPVSVATSSTSLAVASDESCSIDGAQRLSCWGAYISRVPTQLAGLWTRVTGGDSYKCGLQPDGSLWCWGNNASGQLGNGSTVDAVTPTRVGASTWNQVTAGHQNRPCGLQSDNSLWCWGAGVPTPQRIGTATWASIATSGRHACAIAPDATLWCWGRNEEYQTGLGSNASYEIAQPTQINSTQHWLAVSTGDTHTCAIANDHALWCWGDSSHGELGTGSSSTLAATPMLIDSDSWSRISAGTYRTCGIKTDGSLWCWGYLTSPYGNALRLVPTRVGTEANWADVDANYFQSCARKTDNTTYCWGYGATGAIGDGHAWRETPTTIL